MADLTSNDLFKDRGLVKLTDGHRAFAMDTTTHAFNIVTNGHHEVHDGNAYWVSNNATLGNGEINTVAIQTPNTKKWLHLLLQVDSSAVATFDVLESVTSVANGAAITPQNFNRNSTNTSGATAKVGDTVGADALVPTGGTSIWTETLGVKGIVTSRVNASELVLLQNSLYLFRVTNDATANNCTILLIWYEHTNKI